MLWLLTTAMVFIILLFLLAVTSREYFPTKKSNNLYLQKEDKRPTPAVAGVSNVKGCRSALGRLL